MPFNGFRFDLAAIVLMGTRGDCHGLSAIPMGEKAQAAAVSDHRSPGRWLLVSHLGSIFRAFTGENTSSRGLRSVPPCRRQIPDPAGPRTSLDGLVGRAARR